VWERNKNFGTGRTNGVIPLGDRQKETNVGLVQVESGRSFQMMTKKGEHEKSDGKVQILKK